MFQFRRFPAYAYLIQRTLTEYCSAGFPHSVIRGSMLMCSSPRLIAACHDLHRLLMPRHSPCALCSLTSSAQAAHPSLPAEAESSIAPLRLLSGAEIFDFVPGQRAGRPCASYATLVLKNYADHREVQISAFIVLPYSELPQFLASLCLFCCLLHLSSTLFSFQGATFRSVKTRSKCSNSCSSTSIRP